MQVTVVLRPRHAKAGQSLDEIIARGEHISREEYAARYGADPADAEKVRQFASNYGLASSEEDLASRTVKLTGTAAAFSQAFQVELACYQHSGGTISRTHGNGKRAARDQRHRGSGAWAGQSSAGESAFPAGARIGRRGSGVGVLHSPADRCGLRLPYRCERQRARRRHC